jgi:hypothetical protein
VGVGQLGVTLVMSLISPFDAFQTTCSDDTTLFCRNVFTEKERKYGKRKK